MADEMFQVSRVVDNKNKSTVLTRMTILGGQGGGEGEVEG